MTLDVVINGRILSLEATGMTRLSEVIEKIANEHFGPTEIIRSVRLNNREIPDEEVPDLGDMALDEVKSIEIVTIEKPAVEVADQLGRMAKYLNSLEPGLESVADTLRMGGVEEANKNLLEALEGLSAFVELLNNVQMVVKSDIATLIYDGITFQERQDKLLEITENMIESQKTQDWVAVADQIEYELAPAMKEWSNMIPLLESEISKSYQ